MRYIIIANNRKLTAEDLDSIKLKETDQIILFNNMYALFLSEQIKNHPNKILISRRVGDKEKHTSINMCYSAMDIIEQNQQYFQKIFFHPFPTYMKGEEADRCLSSIKKWNIEESKLRSLEPESMNIREKIGYPVGKSMSSGVIVYEYIKKIKRKSDKIILVGFTSEITQACHNESWESKFFREKEKSGECTSLFGYGLEQKKYEMIYDKLKLKSYLTSNKGEKSGFLIDALNPTSIIDIGCGPNLFCKNLQSTSCQKCVGLDFAGGMYDVYGDICWGLTEIKDKEFDLVTAFDTLEHLLPSCINMAMEEMKRISNRFIFLIDHNKSIINVLRRTLHPTVKKEKWWIEKIKIYSNDDIKIEKKFIYGTWKN